MSTEYNCHRVVTALKSVVAWSWEITAEYGEDVKILKRLSTVKNRAVFAWG